MTRFVCYCLTFTGIMSAVIRVAGSPLGLYSLKDMKMILRCSSQSDVLWQTLAMGASDYEEIYIHRIVMPKFRDRFLVSVPYNLEIVNVSLEDAGSYRCVDEGGLGRNLVEYELVVLDSISCLLPSMDKAIGLNSCGIPQSVVNYTCSVVYRGSKPPGFTWIDMSIGNTTDHPVWVKLSADRGSPSRMISSDLTMKAEMKLPEFRCSVEDLLQCTTPEVPVTYVVRSDRHLQFKSSDSLEPVVCRANSSSTCSYTWSADGAVIVYGPTLSKRDLAGQLTRKSEVDFICEAECRLGFRVCRVTVMNVKMNLESHSKAQLLVVIGVSLFIFFGILALLTVGVLKMRTNRGGFNCFCSEPLITRESVPLNQVCFESERCFQKVEPTLLPLHIIARARDYGNRKAFVDSESEETLTYDQLGILVERVAKGLWFDFGVRQGSVVAVVLPNCVQYPVVYHAIMLTGAICVPISYHSTQGELKSCLIDCKASKVITVLGCNEKCRYVLAYFAFTIILIKGDPDSNSPSLEKYFSMEGMPDPRDLPKVVKPLETVAAISYSSGTTGIPKGCLHTHSSYLSNLEQMRDMGMFRPGVEVTVAIVAMSHMYGQDIYLLAGLASGCTMVIMKSFSVREYLRLASQYKVTCAHLVPSQLLVILESDLIPEFDLSELYKVETKAASLHPQVMRLFKEKLPGRRLLKGYGMTEAMCLTKERMEDEETESVGRLLPGVQAKVIGVGSGEVLGPNCKGELHFYSPALFTKYTNRNLRPFDESGFFRSNDLGYFDEQGRLHLIDRVDDLIKCNEDLVSPAEIEEIIARHPKVADVGVVGVAASDTGEAPKAFVVKRVPDLTEEEILRWTTENVSPHKRLHSVEFIEGIPRLPSGKIQRSKLKCQEDPKKVRSCELL